VNTVIHHHEPAGGCGVLRVAEPRVHEDSNVMVPVQEDQWLLAKHNEDRVAELGQLRENEQPCPEAANLVVFDVAEINENEKLIFLSKTTRNC